MHAHMKPWICHGANSRQQQSRAGMQMENAAGWNGMNKQEIQTPGRTHRQGQHNEAAPLLDSCNKWNGGEMLNTLNRIFNIFLLDTWNHVQCQHDFTNPSRKTAELWGHPEGFAFVFGNQTIHSAVDPITPCHSIVRIAPFYSNDKI